MANMVASAVVVPDMEAESTTLDLPSLKKRRQSSHSSTSSAAKRPRLDTNIHEPTGGTLHTKSLSSAVSPPSSTARATESDRRKSATNVSERQRTRRLFGALLGPAAKSAPSKNLSNNVQQRRLEAEKKQAARQAELAAQADEDARVLLLRREAEQKLWDDEGMRLRWESERHKAAFLKTSSHDNELVLYWLPWDLTEDQKATVAEQIKTTDARIVGEGGEASTLAIVDGQDSMIRDDDQSLEQQRNDNASAPELMTTTNTNPVKTGAVEADEIKGNPVESELSTIPNGTTNVENTGADQFNSSMDKELLEDPEGEEADVVVEAGEDAVIY